MSRRPGIGKPWLDKFSSDVYPSDFVVLRGVKMKPPSYYDKIYEVDNPLNMSTLKEQRQKNAKKFAFDNTPERLEVRHKVQIAKAKKLIRPIE